jgi:hypothetical protein
VKAYGVRVRRSGRHPDDDEVSVAYDFPRSIAGSQHPLGIRSSDQQAGGLPAHFGAVRAVVRRRRQAGGARKGRVLYAVHGKQVLAVLAYHVPDRGPLEVVAVGADRRLPRPDAVRFQAHLLACLEEAAQALERPDALAWVTDNRSTADVAEHVHDFKRARKPTHVRARYYLTRPPARRGSRPSN